MEVQRVGIRVSGLSGLLCHSPASLWAMESQAVLAPLISFSSLFRRVQKDSERLAAGATGVPADDTPVRLLRELEAFRREGLSQLLRLDRRIHATFPSGKPPKPLSTDELVADLALRCGWDRTVSVLGKDSSLRLEVASIRSILSAARALRERGDPALALEWCHRHSSRLRRVGARSPSELLNRPVPVPRARGEA